MLAPSDGATVSGTNVPVSASASDNVGVVGVQFTLDGGNLGNELTAAPYTLAWNTTAAANGSHTLSAVARDAAGRTASATAVTVSVSNVADTTPPSVSMSAPANGASVSGTVTVSANASDNVGVAGLQFLLDGLPLGGYLTGAPYSIAWDTTTSSTGSHTLAARASDGAGNQTTSLVVNVTVTAPAPSALAIDAVAWGDQPSKTTTVTTGAFSTTSGSELLLAFVAADDVSVANTVTGVSGAGLTWQLVVRTNAQRGTAEIWRAFAAPQVTNVTVTATLAQAALSSLTVVSFIGADPSGTNGAGAIGAIKSASASTGAPTATLTTTRSGSWVFGVGNDWQAATARTVGANQVMVHQYLAPVGDTFWVQRRTASTTASGTLVTINDTAPTGDRYNLSVVEILRKLP
jgi:hypothetical protein